MHYLLHIPPETNFYLIFYLIGFASAYLIIFYWIYRSARHKAMMTSVTALLILLFILGCKLFPALETWMSVDVVISHKAAAQMAFGGMVLCLLTTVLIKRYLPLPGDFWYYLGLAILLGLILQKPGCLLAGCCKGVHTHFGPTIAYSDGLHRIPLQIYELILYFIAMWIYVRIRNIHRSSKVFFAILLYCIIQFTLEFYREPNDTIAFGDMLYGLKMMQWIYLSCTLISGVLLFMDVKPVILGHGRKSIPSDSSGLLLLLFTSILFYASFRYLYRSEVIAINLAFIPALYFNFRFQLEGFSLRKLKWSAFVSFFTCITLMSQTLKQDSTKMQEVYNSFGIGYHGGRFKNQIINDTDPGSCSGTSYSNEFQQKYSTVTFRFSQTRVRDKSTLSYYVNGTFGGIEETDQRLEETQSHTIASLNPGIRMDTKWVGFGVGAHIGSNYYAKTKAVHNTTGFPLTGLGSTVLYPQFHFRVGPKRILGLEYNFADHFPSALPAFTHELALGTGFGARSGFHIKSGILIGSQTYNSPGGYLKAVIPIERKIIIEPLLGLGTMSDVYMLGVSYRFNSKSIPFKNYQPNSTAK